MTNRAAGLGLEGNQPVNGGVRHRGDGGKRVLEHPEIGDKKQGHDEGHANHFGRPPLERAETGLLKPASRGRKIMRQVHDQGCDKRCRSETKSGNPT